MKLDGNSNKLKKFQNIYLTIQDLIELMMRQRSAWFEFISIQIWSSLTNLDEKFFHDLIKLKSIAMWVKFDEPDSNSRRLSVLHKATTCSSTHAFWA